MRRNLKRNAKIICFVLMLIIMIILKKAIYDDDYDPNQVCNDNTIKIKRLENNIDILLSESDLFKTSNDNSYNVLSDTENDKLFTAYDTDHSKLDTGHKFYLPEHRKTHNENQQKFFLITEYTLVGNLPRFCEQKLDKDQISSFNDEEKVIYFISIFETILYLKCLWLI